MKKSNKLTLAKLESIILREIKNASSDNGAHSVYVNFIKETKNLSDAIDHYKKTLLECMSYINNREDINVLLSAETDIANTITKLESIRKTVELIHSTAEIILKTLDIKVHEYKSLSKVLQKNIDNCVQLKNSSKIKKNIAHSVKHIKQVAY